MRYSALTLRRVHIHFALTHWKSPGLRYKRKLKRTKTRFRMFRRGNCFWSRDGETGKQETLRTKDKATALRLLHAKNEAFQPNVHLRKLHNSALDMNWLLVRPRQKALAKERIRRKAGHYRGRAPENHRHGNQPGTPRVLRGLLACRGGAIRRGRSHCRRC